MASNCTVTPIYPKTLMTSSHLVHNPRLVAPKPSSTHLLHLVSSVRFNSLDHRRSTPPYSAPHASRMPRIRAALFGKKEETIFPGCDYKHWLVVMDFPKDPAPTREEMIDTYIKTLASVVGSKEKAKKNMYGFSITPYTGFQCTVSEETAEKFEDLPGVLFVLPDKYIDVKNKDYGGEKLPN